MSKLKVQKRRVYNGNFTGVWDEVDFFRENFMADVMNATDEERQKDFFSFRVDGKDFSHYFHTFNESVLAYIAFSNGVSKNDLYLTVTHARKILGGN